MQRALSYRQPAVAACLSTSEVKALPIRGCLPSRARWTLAPHRAVPSFIPHSRNLRKGTLLVRAEGDTDGVRRNTEFGYSRKDVILIAFGMIAVGYALYYGLQAAGLEAGIAGNWVQLLVVLGMCFGWVGSYLFRVANKNMTYVTQLERYEEAVMRKRLDEMTDAELETMLANTEVEKAAMRQQLEARRQGEQTK